MAANSTKTSSAVSIVYKTGVDTKGKNILKKQRFNNVKPSASTQDTYDTVMAISPLMEFGVESIENADISVITNA